MAPTGNSTAQKYIHHLESVQAQLNLNDAPELSRRGEKAKKDKEAERYPKSVLGVMGGLAEYTTYSTSDLYNDDCINQAHSFGANDGSS